MPPAYGAVNVSCNREAVGGLVQVERVVTERVQVDDGSLQYLVKWKGLPYSEATWESVEDIHKAGGSEFIDEFQVAHHWHITEMLCKTISRLCMWTGRTTRPASNVLHVPQKEPDITPADHVSAYRLHSYVLELSAGMQAAAKCARPDCIQQLSMAYRACIGAWDRSPPNTALLHVRKRPAW